MTAEFLKFVLVRSTDKIMETDDNTKDNSAAMILWNATYELLTELLTEVLEEKERLKK